ncbi:hypothetical protein QVD17_32958 [Tagetes erecta]|uniref:Uncharacterized protein n=1 Tax=Tagetes erecta TaxID=13708 RepID=A0AAD8NKU9_TARER|nr:hypothetical protein QVD17_32958 [Tagetes erecta]
MLNKQQFTDPGKCCNRNFWRAAAISWIIDNQNPYFDVQHLQTFDVKRLLAALLTTISPMEESFVIVGANVVKLMSSRNELAPNNPSHIN